MSRVAKKPIELPQGVKVSVSGQEVWVEGPKGKLFHQLHDAVEASLEGNEMICRVVETRASTRENLFKFAGTARALLNNMVIGVTQGFEKRLQLVGVGYRAVCEGRRLTMNLGFSHPCHYSVPEAIQVACASPTEIRVTGLDKQKVGQVAADIRGFKPPEPYKGKGIRYHNEVVITKEAKKK